MTQKVKQWAKIFEQFDTTERQVLRIALQRFGSQFVEPGYTCPEYELAAAMAKAIDKSKS